MMLVFTPVRDLKWDDTIVDQHGRRHIVEMRREINRAYIEFDSGPNGWFLDVEQLPVEHLS